MTVNFLELEITGFCQLACRHCYANAGPEGNHGTMTTLDWRSVIDQASAIDVEMVQFIGGEPTLHPDFGQLLQHAIDAGRKVEVFSNLVHVKEAWWELFASPMVSLATSYYSDQASGHEQVTGRRGSHARTRASIAESVRRKIPIRAGIIDVLDGQRVEEARTDLEAVGVTDVGTDRLRGVGRAAHTLGAPDVSQLCGRCGRDKAAVSPDGDVWPCVLARWMCAGNVKQQPLEEILGGPKMRDLVSAIPSPRGGGPCDPDCKPSKEGSDCAPAEREACYPKFCKPER
ncbi:MAG: radical SAM protein [Streptosporangiales bacterium]|nr:radical SAM protein [Streptosporangiales bacterium]